MMLPSFIVGIDPNTAKLTGVVIFLIGVQLHSFYVSKANKDDTTNRLMSLHQDYQVYQEYAKARQGDYAEIFAKYQVKSVLFYVKQPVLGASSVWSPVRVVTNGWFFLL